MQELVPVLVEEYVSLLRRLRKVHASILLIRSLVCWSKYHEGHVSGTIRICLATMFFGHDARLWKSSWWKLQYAKSRNCHSIQTAQSRVHFENRNSTRKWENAGKCSTNRSHVLWCKQFADIGWHYWWSSEMEITRQWADYLGLLQKYTWSQFESTENRQQWHSSATSSENHRMLQRR